MKKNSKIIKYIIIFAILAEGYLFIKINLGIIHKMNIVYMKNIQITEQKFKNILDKTDLNFYYYPTYTQGLSISTYYKLTSKPDTINKDITKLYNTNRLKENIFDFSEQIDYKDKGKIRIKIDFKMKEQNQSDIVDIYNLTNHCNNLLEQPVISENKLKELYNQEITKSSNFALIRDTVEKYSIEYNKYTTDEYKRLSVSIEYK